MKEFQAASEELYWDGQTKAYCPRRDKDPQLDETNKDLDRSKDQPTESSSLWISIKSFFSNNDRIDIKNDDQPSIINEPTKIYEFHKKDVVFDACDCVIIILKDISELVKVEYSKSVERVTDMMVAQTSHDMRTPLNSVINMHMMIETRVTDKKVLKWLQVAKNSTNLLLFLVNDTLDFYQIKSGKFSQCLGNFNLKELTQGCLDLIAIQMEQKGLQQIFEIDPSIEDAEFTCDK